MSAEDAKKNLDAKLAKMGYIHPKEDNSSRTPQYMAYSVTEEQKTREKPGEYISQQNYDPYATFNTENSSRKNDICPTCELSVLYACDCKYRDMMCPKGHMWYIEKGEVKVGDPHEEQY